MIFCIGLIWMWSSIRCVQAVDCFPCSSDYRSKPFDYVYHDDTCLFPPEDGTGKTSCSPESKYCQGLITRINGAFAQFQRTCEVTCRKNCKVKGFGIVISECTFCCNKSSEFSCGKDGYKSGE